MSYSSVTWNSGDPVSTSKLSQMAANEDFLNSSLPDIEWYEMDNPTPINSNIVIIAAQVDLGFPTVSLYDQNINFPAGSFAADCVPVVVCTLVKKQSKDTGLVIHGQDGTMNITATGFRVSVVHDNQNSPHNTTLRLNYIAIGWNEAT